MTAIHQFTAGYSHADAISNELRTLRDIIRGWGHPSEIFCETRRILPELRDDCRDIQQAAELIAPDDIVILHLSIGSLVNQRFHDLDCRKVIIYHNMTPAEFLMGIHEELRQNLLQGRRQLEMLVDTADINLAVSAYNASELTEAGYADVQVFPLVLDFDFISVPPDRSVLRRFQDDFTTILFVGRCVPNKRLEDCLSTFHYFQRFVEPRSRFIHVGSCAGTEKYRALLQAYARELGLEHVHLLGSIPQAELSACYHCADLFLCMSEHEGFCIPLVESMAHNVPVLAHAACAVPETLDGAGVLVHEKQFDAIAEMMGELTRPTPLRNAVIKGQQQRLQRYQQRNLDQELREHLSPLLAVATH